LAPTAKNGFNGRNFYYTWIQLTLYNNWQQFGSNRRQKNFRKKTTYPPFYIIFTSENHLNAHSSLIKQHMAMNFAPLDCPCPRRFFWVEKNLPGFFHFRENRKKPKNPYFWLPQQKMGSMAGTFTIPEFNWPYTITDSNLVRIGDKKISEKKPRTPPFYIIFTSENHLNAHSSLIKQHMAMNFAPLDCPCQGASSESKKIYLDFFILEKIAKNQKIHIFGSHSKKWVQWPELLLYLNSTDPIQ
jgi:hypothetical protein